MSTPPIADIYEQLLAKATEDGVISPEEQAILNQAKFDLDYYEKLLQLAVLDDIITSDESNQLKVARNKILKGAWVVADEDAVITKDEAELLNLLLKILKDIESPPS
ncbi:MAG: hypothetical protein ACXAB7_23795 [Candidatus Kariarchaeaceae archaeon]|jgi:hypothetical protein